MGQSKASSTVLHYAPEVLAVASSSLERLNKLLAICDYHSAALSQKTFDHKSDSTKETQSLIRMVLSLQNALDKYTQILYPPALSNVYPNQAALTNICMPTLSQATTGESSSEKAYEASIEEAETLAPAYHSEPVISVSQKEMSETLMGNHDTETLENSVPKLLTELSISGEQAHSEVNFNETTTDAWEETTLSKIDDLRQKILNDIETGKLSRRRGMEMIGDMEWRFKRTLIEKRAADQNRKSRSQWAAGQ